MIKINANYIFDRVSASKFFIIAFIFCCLLSTSNQVVAVENNNKPYTVLVYMVGSTLENTGIDEFAFGSMAIEEILASSNNPNNVNILLQTGGCKKWKNQQISNQRVQRWQVDASGLQLKDDTIGNVSMARASTLSDYIVWSVRNYPADKYMLIMWDHGLGAFGFGWDENFNEIMRLPELRRALSSAKQEWSGNFEVIGFDCCLMANVETANTIKEYANYLVASEEATTDTAWDLNDFFTWLRRNPQTDGVAIGKELADGYLSKIEELNRGDAATLSTINLANIPTVTKNIDALAQKINKQIDSADANTKDKILLQIAKARNDTEYYGSIDAKEANDMIDIIDLMDHLKIYWTQEADDVIKAVNAAVSDNLQFGREQARGLSIFFPYNLRDKDNLSGCFSDEKQSAGMPEYVKLITDFNANMDKYSSNFSVPQQSAISNSHYYSGNAVLTMTIPLEVRQRVCNIELLIGQPKKDDNNTVILYSVFGQNLRGDLDNGEVAATPELFWMNLNGQNITANVINYDQGTNRHDFSIPVKYNGEDVYFLAYSDAKTSLGGSIYGIARTQGNEAALNGAGAVIERMSVEFEPGDKIIPYVRAFNRTTGEIKLIEGDEIEITNNLYFRIARNVPKGNYLLGVLANYFGGGGYTSDLFDFTVN